MADGALAGLLATLDRLEAELPDDLTLFVGHGSPGGKDLLAAQRRYIETFVNAVEAPADAIDANDHRGVIVAIQRLLPHRLRAVPDGPQHQADPRGSPPGPLNSMGPDATPDPPVDRGRGAGR